MTDLDQSAPGAFPEDATTAGLSTAPAPIRQPQLGVLGWARWSWRQLTSMRTALVLLFLLAVGSVPGSLVPQVGSNPAAVQAFRASHRWLGPLYTHLGMFDVFRAPWFSAVYLLLFVSLVGCVVPRSRRHWQAMRAAPPRAPRVFTRMPVSDSWVTTVGPDEVLRSAREVLRRKRFRVVGDASTLSAEKGYLRETGNLLFHAALLGLLLSVGLGSAFGFKGNVLVPVGGGFSNLQADYSGGFTHGVFFDTARLQPFSVHLDSFAVRYQIGGQQNGAPRDFTGRLTYTTAPGATPRTYELRVNHPLSVGGADVFLVGNGYAPRVTVRDGTGRVVFSGPVPFIPQDGNLTSTGVVKVPDATPSQLAFQGFFLPTSADGSAVSLFPDALRPVLYVVAFRGDLGINNGAPQSVFTLDTRPLTKLTQGALTQGKRITLPGGYGSVTYDGYVRWVTLQVSRNPGQAPGLACAALALVGLVLSLFVRRRRVWFRATADPAGRTVVEVAGLSRTEGDDLDEEVAALAAAMQADAAPSGVADGDGAGSAGAASATRTGE